jgi:hypothetical protein
MKMDVKFNICELFSSSKSGGANLISEQQKNMMGNVER